MNNIKKNIFLAIDLGASSGRAIVGKIENNKLDITEINRFSNPIITINGRAYWDLLNLYDKIIESIKITVKENLNINSIGIDTWGVDFVCFGKDGEPLRMPYSYRDLHTLDAPELFFKKVSKELLYEKTGIQFLNFNSIFQLDTQLRNDSSIYPLIDKVLFMPDALTYLLTGKMITEYTIASTSQLINPLTKNFDKELLSAIELKESNFAPIVFPGTSIGPITEEVKQQTCSGDINVISVAGHDTASAVFATPAYNDNFAYLSSGTWSLIGIETEQPVINDYAYNNNITNEGGADGSIRLLKNICGMWLIEQCKKEWDKECNISYSDIVKAAEESKPFYCFINPDSPEFAAPDSMTTSIKEYCRKTAQPIPETIGEIARCIYESLAFRYTQVLDILKELHKHPVEKLHIIGGGSKNNLLNQFTANAMGIEVIAGPSEATAIGNLMIQAKAAGIVNSKNEIRQIIRNSTNLESFVPEEKETWNYNYERYLKVFQS